MGKGDKGLLWGRYPIPPVFSGAGVMVAKLGPDFSPILSAAITSLPSAGVKCWECGEDVTSLSPLSVWDVGASSFRA